MRALSVSLVRSHTLACAYAVSLSRLLSLSLSLSLSHFLSGSLTSPLLRALFHTHTLFRSRHFSLHHTVSLVCCLLSLACFVFSARVCSACLDIRALSHVSMFMCTGCVCSHAGHGSFIWVTWLMHMCDMTHSYEWQNSFICVTKLIHMSDMPPRHTSSTPRILSRARARALSRLRLPSPLRSLPRGFSLSRARALSL